MFREKCEWLLSVANKVRCPVCKELMFRTPSGYLACIDSSHTGLRECSVTQETIEKAVAAEDRFSSLPVATRSGPDARRYLIGDSPYKLRVYAQRPCKTNLLKPPRVGILAKSESGCVLPLVQESQ